MQIMLEEAVIEAIGVGIDFKDGDLALRGNYSTLDENEVITDRRAWKTDRKRRCRRHSKRIRGKNSILNTRHKNCCCTNNRT